MKKNNRKKRTGNKNLIAQLAVALECASVCNTATMDVRGVPQAMFVASPSNRNGWAWGATSPFQRKINELLRKSKKYREIE